MIDIFYKTYSKDFKWLYYSLMSIRKFVTGYNKIIIIIPESDYNFFDKSKLDGLNCEVHLVNEYGNGYLYQQWIKMSAYKYSSSEYILFVDSDCIFDIEVDLSDIVKNKIKLYYTDYNKVGDAICWKKPTEKFINREVNYEFMRRNFLLFHRTTLVNIHNKYPDLENYIMSTDPLFGFSEYNAIGAWIFYNESDIYDLKDTDYCEPESIGVQFWSHSELNDDDLESIKKILD